MMVDRDLHRQPIGQVQRITGDRLCGNPYGECAADKFPRPEIGELEFNSGGVECHCFRSSGWHLPEKMLGVPG